MKVVLKRLRKEVKILKLDGGFCWDVPLAIRKDLKIFGEEGHFSNLANKQCTLHLYFHSIIVRVTEVCAV